MATGIYQEFGTTTTDASPVTCATVVIPLNTSATVEGNLTARRTGGVSGATGDTASYVLKAAVKNISGTLTILSQEAVLAAEDQDWAVAFATSGSNLLLNVSGAAGNTIVWTCYLNLFEAD